MAQRSATASACSSAGLLLGVTLLTLRFVGSGQMADQSLGRISWRVTSPAVAASTACT